MDDQTVENTAKRISEYVDKASINRLLIVLHGGEPLLAGKERIENIVRNFRDSISDEVDLDFSIQTNGTFLDEKFIEHAIKLDIGISISIDGYKEANDLHRLNHKGESTFSATNNALKLLKENGEIFAGIISVIDPSNDPKKLLHFFNQFNPPSIDFLLPDANYINTPKLRSEHPDIYLNWLIKCFDLWFDEYSHLNVRFFDQILKSIVGLPSSTDAFGLGDVSLLSIETDGAYHDLDVLKITKNGATDLKSGSVHNTSIFEALNSKKLQGHRQLLRFEGLADKCKSCKFVQICGGGAVPHRYSKSGFKNPTIYCHEMFNFIEYVRDRLHNEVLDNGSKNEISLNISIDFHDLENEQNSISLISDLNNHLSKYYSKRFKSSLTITAEKHESSQNECNYLLNIDKNFFRKLSLMPSVVLWSNVVTGEKEGRQTTNINGKAIAPDFNYPPQIIDLSKRIKNSSKLLIHRKDNWLRLPFGDKIKFESDSAINKVMPILKNALNLIQDWNKFLYDEILLLSPELQFIRDLEADPDKIVSFSDNTVPGAIYVSVFQGDNIVSYYDLADSIIHEYRHQKLYLVQQAVKLIEADSPLLTSPWRDDPRPPSGLLHATYVFLKLLDYWKYVKKLDDTNMIDRASYEITTNTKRLKVAFDKLKECDLTNNGSNFINVLESEFQKINATKD